MPRLQLLYLPADASGARMRFALIVDQVLDPTDVATADGLRAFGRQIGADGTLVASGTIDIPETLEAAVNDEPDPSVEAERTAFARVGATFGTRIDDLRIGRLNTRD